MSGNQVAAVIMAIHWTPNGYVSDITVSGGLFTVWMTGYGTDKPVPIRMIADLPTQPRALAKGLLDIWGMK